MNRSIQWLLRAEGLVVLIGAILAFARLDGGWLFFALLFLLPDLSMVGYLKDERIGSITYNTVHTYLGPAVLGGMAWWSADVLVAQAALIWAAHIGLDRFLSYGLKLPSAFDHTHLVVNDER